MKVRASHFAEDIAKVNWQGIPADMKKDGLEIRDKAAKFYSEGGDIAKGIDLYVAALNKKLEAAKPKAAPKKKAATKKTPATDKAKAEKAKQAEEARKANEQMLNQAAGGQFKNFTRAQILEYAQLFNQRRKLSAQMLDAAVDHKKRLSPTPENLIRWMKEPGKYDLIGVDTFKKDDPTADLKIKKEIFWHRLLKK